MANGIENPFDTVAWIDEQLKFGQRTAFNTEYYDIICPHCGRDWHGLPLKNWNGVWCYGSHKENGFYDTPPCTVPMGSTDE